MAIEIPKPRWPGDPGPGKPKKPYPTTSAPRAVRPEIYGVMPVAQVESLLRREQMPAPFIRRMRVINLLSALTLRKIEDNMIAPFNVMDIHHVLDEQISQDAIIAMLENKNLALALETGNMQPLWVESKENPLLRKGFEQRWIQRFITTPFDPVCVMLAMRAKLMLDVVDELGHSYDLLRSLGMGWIDFGEIPGELPGDPDDYIPPLVDQPIDDPDIPPGPVPDEPEPVPEPGDPGYIPPADLTPGDPGYTTEPGSPGYIPPADLAPGDPGYTTDPGSPGYIPPGEIVPGDPGYVPGPDEPGYIPPPNRGPGDPGYDGVPGEPPGYPRGWDEAIHPGHPDYEPGRGERGYYPGPSPGGGFYGGDYGPGGKGAPGGPYGAGGDYASLLPPLPLGYGPGWMLSGRGFGGRWAGFWIDCCADKDDPLLPVEIGAYTDAIGCDETLGLTVDKAHEDCKDENYTWGITQGLGELSTPIGKTTIYTAPPCVGACEALTIISLTCDEEVVDTLEITITCCDCEDIEIGYTTQQMAVDEVQTLTAIGGVEGCTYDWTIDSGGGELSSPTGASVIYTAPSSNANCENNPVISLSVNEEVCDTVAFAVNASANGWAWALLECRSSTAGYCLKYSCDDSFISEEYCCGTTGGAGQTCSEICPDLLDWRWELTPVDVRSADQKAAGCCPAELL